MHKEIAQCLTYFQQSSSQTMVFLLTVPFSAIKKQYFNYQLGQLLELYRYPGGSKLWIEWLKGKKDILTEIDTWIMRYDY